MGSHNLEGEFIQFMVDQSSGYVHKVDFSLIKDAAKQAGLSLVGAICAEPLAQDRDRLIQWQNSLYAGEMGYMNRDPGLLSSPKLLLEQSASVISFALHYSRAAPFDFEADQSLNLSGFGKVARYAWGRDYHRVLKKRLHLFIKSLHQLIKREFQYRVFTDSVPFLERAAASSAGLGFIGKNSMLIVPKLGSFCFIAEALVDFEVVNQPKLEVKENCGSCTNCSSNCPTGAIVSDRVIDARKCISYLTIEKRGMLDEWERKAIGEWIFGCDICQDVCPFNHTVLKNKNVASIPEFNPENGKGHI